MHELPPRGRHLSVQNLVPALFVLTYPSLALLVHGGASALAIVAGLATLAALLWPTGRARIEWNSSDWQISLALAAPLVAVLLSEAMHGRLLPSTLDSPARFLAAVPLYLVLRGMPLPVLSWSDLSFACGALSALAIVTIAPHDWGFGRISSSFLDPIHFGDIALVLGMLSVLSLNGWRKDSLPVRVLKIAGLAAGLYVSLRSGSRGGWVAIPVVAFLVPYLRGGQKSMRWKVAIPLVVIAGMLAVYGLSPTVRGRVNQLNTNMHAYTHGNKDTSLGIRLQLYEAGMVLMARQPIWGLGSDGFRDSMQALADSGRLTQSAAQFGKGETHDQLLAYTVDYGLIGGVALMAIYVVPGLLFWRCVRAQAPMVGRAGLMGLVFVVSFWIFGLSVETFDLKAPTAFYATVVAVLAGIAAHVRSRPGAGGNASR